MKRLFSLAFVMFVLGTPQLAWAQRRGHSGPAMTPYGPVINPTQTAEWRQAGGNPIIYQQILQQKMMAAQQKMAAAQQKAAQQHDQQLAKQQKAYEKWLKEQKAKKDKGQPVDPAYQRMLDQEAQSKAAVEARAARIAAKKEKHRIAIKKLGSAATEVKKDVETDPKN